MDIDRENSDLVRIAADVVRSNYSGPQHHNGSYCQECAKANYSEQWTLPNIIRDVKTAEEVLKEMGYTFESSSWFGYVCHIAVALLKKEDHERYCYFESLAKGCESFASAIKRMELSDIILNVKQLAPEVRYIKSRWHKAEASKGIEQDNPEEVWFTAYPILENLNNRPEPMPTFEPKEIVREAKNPALIPTIFPIERYEIYLSFPKESIQEFMEKYKKQIAVAIA